MKSLAHVLALLAVALLLRSPNSEAQATAYVWRCSGTGCSNQSSPQAAAGQLLSLCTASAGAGCTGTLNCGNSGGCANACGDQFELLGVTAGTWPAYTFQLRRFRPSTSAYCTMGSNTLTATANPQGAPTCPAAGTNVSSVIEGDATVGAGACGSDGCAYTVASPVRSILLSGGFGRVATVQSVGRPCATSQETVSYEPADSEDCISASGNIACNDAAAPGGQGCGYFNGDYICTGHVPDNSCVEFSSGAVACVAGAASAPTAPGGGAATPTGTVSNGSTTVNYYDNTIVNSSSTTVTSVPGQGGSAIGAPGRDGSSAGAGGSGGGDTIVNCVEGEPCVEVDLEGECPEGETCDGSLPNGGTFGDVCTFGECALAFYNRVRGAPIVAAVLGAGAAMPAGACPNWTLEAFDEDYSLSAPMCDIWENVSPVLSAIFLVIWGWVATRIVLSA